MGFRPECVVGQVSDLASEVLGERCQLGEAGHLHAAERFVGISACAFPVEFRA
jgi:hypothetical protein